MFTPSSQFSSKLSNKDKTGENSNRNSFLKTNPNNRNNKGLKLYITKTENTTPISSAKNSAKRGVINPSKPSYNKNGKGFKYNVDKLSSNKQDGSDLKSD